jgi:prolipoprotein diacylglyceryltransferase
MLNTTTIAAFGFGGMELLFILMMLVAFAFWIWMIVDCATKEEEGSKIAWILVIVLVGFIGAPLYFIVRKIPRKPKNA